MNPRVGIYYTVGAVVLAMAAWFARPWGYLLLWPATSVTLVAIGYFCLGQKVYGKLSGQHARWARLLHWFTIQGHELSRRAYAKGCEPWNQLLPDLLIGRQLEDKEATLLKQAGAKAVLDLTSEFSEPETLRKLNYLCLPILDLTAPSDEEVDTALDFIDRNRCSGKVYLHCKIGYSRTAAIAGSYLIHAGHATDTNEAIRQLQQARPSIIIRPEARTTIERYAAKCLPS